MEGYIMENTDTTIKTTITINKRNRVLMRLLVKELSAIGAIEDSEADLIIAKTDVL
jgi:hypothetical protein